MDLVIDEPAALREFVASIADAPRLAVDSEGDGFHRYRAKLCTVQIAAGEREGIVDTLALEDLSPLGALLSDEAHGLVFHDVGFDARMLFQRGIRLAGVFDTSVAARFLSEPSTGLGSLLQKVLGIEVDKGLQQADWGIRPIPEDRLGYLIGDVQHLHALAEHFEARVREADIVEEVDEETRYAMVRAEEPEVEKEPWTRIKKSRDLSKPQLALLKALCDVREEVASDVDVPPFRIAPNAGLLEAARRLPKTARDLSRVRGLRKLPRSGLARALETAERDGPPPPPPPPPPAEVRARRKAREKALQVWRNTEAERREVNVQVVLPGHCMRDIAALEDGEDVRSVAGFGDKRDHLYTKAIEAALRGAE